MHPILALLTAGLLSIHQYIPVDNTKYIKYFDDVRQLEAVNVFSAANQSCLYLKSVFINVGLEQTLGESLLNNSFGNILREELQEDSVFQSVVDILKSSAYSSKLKSYNLDVETAIQFFNSLCREDFSPVDFSSFERQAVLDIIKNEINILSPADLNSLGSFFYFGSIPVLSRKGQVLASLNTNYRKWISYNEIPNHLILALLATEDRRFFIHNGADEIAISRMAKMIIGHERITGGSTLTMQLLKNMYFSNRSSKKPLFKTDKGALLLRKVREWRWAKPFEKYFYRESAPLSSKKKILEYYFNLIGFGNGIQGAEQASQIYFSKPVQDLSLAEAAYIVTLLKAPQRYSNPSNYDNYTKGRRDDYVLNRIAGLCSEIHRSQFLTDKKEIKSLMQNLCKDGEQKIDSRYIESEKKTKLPLWEPPEFLDTDDSVIPIKRQIREVLNTIKFQSSNSSKELTVHTTIDENLQKILFQVMKGYLDEHDQTQDQLTHVKPIKDSAGRKMLILPEDNKFLTYTVEGFLSSFERKKRKWLYNIRLNPNPSFDSNSFQVDSAKEFFKGFSLLSNQDIENVIRDIQNELLKRSGQVGSILFVELKPDHFSIFTLDQMLDKLRLKREESKSSVNRINQLEETLSVRKIQEKLYKNALSRIYNLRSRDYLEPVLYLGEDVVINRSFKKVSLSPADYQQIKRYKSGDFFWTKKQEGAYKLQGEKLQASALIMNSNTGEILAGFDGYNLKNNYFYRSTQAKRQIGSLIKPFVYLYALDRESFDLQTILNNHSVVIPVSRSQNYIPKNISNKYLGPLAFIQAFIHSQNIATVSLIQDPNWGDGHWRDNLNELMIFFKSAGLYKNYNRSLYPSLLLGSKEETLSQIVSSFSLFANGLYSANPYFIKQIKNYKDSVMYKSNVYNYVPYLKRKDSLFQIRSVLLQTANTGTIGQLNNFVYNLEEGKYRDVCYNNLLSAKHQACFGGKTGTSDNGEDIWFVGFSKNFVIGLWMGYDVRSPIGWSSAKLASVFQSIVEQGIDYLPPIKPVMNSLDKPYNLEKRQVFGSRACSRLVGDNESSYVIYTDRDSPDNPCNDEEYFSQNKPDPEEDNGNCQCLKAKEVEVNPIGQEINEVLGYALDITYQGQLYKNQGFYQTLAECESDKSSYVAEESGIRVCR